MVNAVPLSLPSPLAMSTKLLSAKPPARRYPWIARRCGWHSCFVLLRRRRWSRRPGGLLAQARHAERDFLRSHHVARGFVHRLDVEEMVLARDAYPFRLAGWRDHANFRD